MCFTREQMSQNCGQMELQVTTLVVDKDPKIEPFLRDRLYTSSRGADKSISVLIVKINDMNALLVATKNNFFVSEISFRANLAPVRRTHD